MISSFGVDVGFATVGKIKFLCNSCFPEITDSFLSNPSIQLENIRIAAMCLQSSLPFIETFASSNDPSPTRTSTAAAASTSVSPKLLSDVQYALLTASERLTMILSDKYSQWDTISSTKQWYTTCEESIYALYHIHPYPEEIICKLILSCFISWKNSITSQLSSTIITCRLARFLFVLGQGLLGILLYTEKMATFSKGIKDKNMKEYKNQSQATTTTTTTRKKKITKNQDQEVTAEDEESKSKSKGTSRSKKRKDDEENEQDPRDQDIDNNVNAMEEEMGLVAAIDADHEKVINSPSPPSSLSSPFNF